MLLHNYTITNYNWQKRQEMYMKELTWEYFDSETPPGAGDN